MNVVAPKPVQTEQQKIEFATEVAFEALIKKAIANGFLLLPLQVGLNNLPNETIKQQFKDTCKNILNSLRDLENDAVQSVENEQGHGVV